VPRAGIVGGLLGLTLAVGMVAGAVPMSAATPPDPFRAVDHAMSARVKGQGGGAVLVVRDRTVLHERGFDGFSRTKRFPIASASKWLTTATLLTLVDAGQVGLDDPVARFLPAFAADKATITIRSLLSHTSGLTDPSCIDDPTTTIARCVAEIASLPPSAPPRTFFHYSSVGYEVTARIIEVVTGETFEHAFEDRIGRPLGMASTRFDRVGTVTTKNPDPASAAVSTVADWARYLDMVLHLGRAGPRQILSLASVAEIERDQVAGLDTRADAAVQITRIPTYGLGVWRDVPDATDNAVVVSGNGGLGFYPWVDRSHGTFGLVAVDDERGSEVAVPASQRVARLEWTTAASAP
jgi:CubicO group peptidase (beta-lactamase class C family)